MNKMDEILENDNLEEFKELIKNTSFELDNIILRSSMYDSLNIFKFIIENHDLSHLQPNIYFHILNENGNFCFENRTFKVSKWFLTNERLKYKVDILKGNLALFSIIGYNGELDLFNIIFNNNYPKLKDKTEQAAILKTILRMIR